MNNWMDVIGKGSTLKDLL